MLGKITITNLDGKDTTISIYDIEEIKEGKGGGFLWDLGMGVQGQEAQPCIVVKIKSEKKNIKTTESVKQIKEKIRTARGRENFENWLATLDRD